MSLVGVPPQLHAGPLSVENLPVQLQAVAVSVVSNSSVVADVSAAAPVDAAITAATTNSGALAAATGDFATALGHTIATVAGLALAPIWYLAFPITTTMWDVVIAPLFFPDYPKTFGIPGFAVFLTSWFVPFKLDDILFSTVLAPAATSAATARAAATATATATASPATEVPAADTAAIATSPQRRGDAFRNSDSERAAAPRSTAAKLAAAGPGPTAKPAAAERQRSAKSTAAVQSSAVSKTDNASSKKGAAARP